MSFASPTLLLVLAVLLFAGISIYYASLPKPLPGIPYDKESARKPFGDLPEAMAHLKETGVMMDTLRDKCIKLNEPLVQVFFRPFDRPFVVLCDGREAQDIMTQRTKEFDRSKLFGELFRAYLPHSQISMPTDKQWRFNRGLVSETMSPKFLENVAAPRSFEAANDLIRLWREKTRLAAGFTFDVQDDINMAVADVIWAATFGSDLEACKTQAAYLSGIAHIPLPANDARCVEMPKAKAPEAYMALVTLFNSSQIALQNPFGYYAHRFAILTYPSLRHAMKVKDGLVGERIQNSYKKFAEGSGSKTGSVRAAVDLVVEREVAAARKEKREPLKANRKYMHDELSLFLSAGSTTTAESLSWGVKYLTAFQKVQSRLRKDLRTKHYDAAAQGIQPAAEDIARTQIPYLEAVIHETLRYGSNINGHVRTAKVDTHVLGYPIPKGTEVFMMLKGPSFHSAALKVDDTKRSRTSQASTKEATRKWSQSGLDRFDPERWLVKSENGEMEFDIRAAPMQTFGEGPRSCFGQRLAQQELRILYTLMLWTFEFLPIDPSLVDFDQVEELTLKPRNVRVKLREVKP